MDFRLQDDFNKMRLCFFIRQSIHCATISAEAIPFAKVSGGSCRKALQSFRRNAPLLVSASARELRQYWAKARVSVCIKLFLIVIRFIKFNNFSRNIILSKSTKIYAYSSAIWRRITSCGRKIKAFEKFI